MAALLGLLAAVAFGSADFLAGVASRRTNGNLVAFVAQLSGVAVALVAVAAVPFWPPGWAALGWGAVAGVGNAIGTVMLYRGLAAGQMAIVGPVSAVVTAVLPAVFGVATGERVGALVLIGIGLSVPGVFLVSRTRAEEPGGSFAPAGVWYGIAAGLGFAVLFVALDQAGTGAGAWPLASCQLVTLVILAGWWLLMPRRGTGLAAAGWRRLALLAGLLGGCANLLFLIATGAGQLAVVAVLTAMYPAVTVILARFVLLERVTRVQLAGLMITLAAVAFVTAGSAVP